MRSYVTSQEEPVYIYSQYHTSVKNEEKKAIVSGLDSDPGILSLSYTSKVEIDREAVESCHFQPEVHKVHVRSRQSKHEQRIATMEAKDTPQ